MKTHPMKVNLIFTIIQGIVTGLVLVVSIFRHDWIMVAAILVLWFCYYISLMLHLINIKQLVKLWTGEDI